MVQIFGGVMASQGEAPKTQTERGTQLVFPGGQAALANDGTLVLFSAHGAISIGTDGVAKLHSAAKVTRAAKVLDKLSGSLMIGEITARQRFDHGKSAPHGAIVPSALFDGLQKGIVKVRMRPDEVGFTGKSYTAKTRPLDVTIEGKKTVMSLTIRPGGKVEGKVIARVPMGIRAKPRQR